MTTACENKPKQVFFLPEQRFLQVQDFRLKCNRQINFIFKVRASFLEISQVYDFARPRRDHVSFINSRNFVSDRVSTDSSRFESHEFGLYERIKEGSTSATDEGTFGQNWTRLFADTRQVWGMRWFERSEADFCLCFIKVVFGKEEGIGFGIEPASTRCAVCTYFIFSPRWFISPRIQGFMWISSRKWKNWTINEIWLWKEQRIGVDINWHVPNLLINRNYNRPSPNIKYARLSFDVGFHGCDSDMMIVGGKEWVAW